MNMSTATAAKLTAEEFFEFVHLPENENKSFELDRGEVIEMPSPTHPHCLVTANAARILGNYAFAVSTCYVLSNDAGVILQREPDIVRGPDVAVYNGAATKEELHPKYGEVAPILAVEVLSPNDRPMKVTRKIADYLRAGTELVWLMDPETCTVSVHRRNAEPQPIDPDGEVDGADVLPGFRCAIADFFRFPQRPAARAADVSPPL
jgi:Uma2 family endonuclease